ncbi:hypothetical protein DF112_24270 [Burkholderia stagnalis]|nr:hypothetical protein DF112_24270 [Burkholderia stagnalis]
MMIEAGGASLHSVDARGSCRPHGGAGHLAGALRFQGEIDGLRAPTEFRLAPGSSLRPQLREILADRERPYYEHQLAA